MRNHLLVVCEGSRKPGGAAGGVLSKRPSLCLLWSQRSVHRLTDKKHLCTNSGECFWCLCSLVSPSRREPRIIGVEVGNSLPGLLQSYLSIPWDDWDKANVVVLTVIKRERHILDVATTVMTVRCCKCVSFILQCLHESVSSCEIVIVCPCYETLWCFKDSKSTTHKKQCFYSTLLSTIWKLLEFCLEKDLLKGCILK